MNLKTWIATGAVAVVVVGGSITGATVHNAQVQADAQAQHVLVVKAAKIASDQVAAAAQAVIDAAAAQKVLDDAAAAKAAADALAAQQAADAAAAQAAATAAANAAAAQTVTTAPVQRATVAAPTAPAPIKCPAGSSANSGDAGNDTSCFPDICFHIMLPDPAHPECVTAFKP